MFDDEFVEGAHVILPCRRLLFDMRTDLPMRPRSMLNIAAKADIFALPR